MLIHLSCKKTSNEAAVTDKNVLNEGIIAYYPFNTNANDESGNGYNLTVKGATLTSDRFGRASNAYNFNGKDAIMEIPKFTKAATINNFTISIWAKPQIDHQAYLITLKNDSTNEMAHSVQLINYTTYYESWNEIAKCATSNGVKSCSTLQVHQNIPDPTGKWTHIVFGQDNDKPFLYVDGQKLVTTGLNRSPISFNYGGYIGTVIFGYYGFYKGDLDDIRIYNRALTQDEVQQLHNEKP